MRLPTYREDVRQRLLGTTQSPELRARKSAKQRGTRLGSANPNWKGDDVGYWGLHAWVRGTLAKTGVCSECGRDGKTDWANVSGQYRRVEGDWVEMCRRCHYWHDRRRREQ